eukprot:14980961-Alexandrium_andersonii.AAC.1
MCIRDRASGARQKQHAKAHSSRATNQDTLQPRRTTANQGLLQRPAPSTRKRGRNADSADPTHS